MESQAIILFILLIITFSGTILTLYLFDKREKYLISDKIINKKLGLCTYEICHVKNDTYTSEIVVTKNIINFCYDIGPITKKEYLKIKGE